MRPLLFALAVCAVGIGVRAAVVASWPTRPFSDFAELVRFAVALRDGAPADTWWSLFGPGTSTLLAMVMRVVPGDPSAVARAATVVWTGLLPLMPIVIWRGVLGVRARVVAAALLALWPAQLFFAGVVAQDNWVLTPLVALGALAVRVVFASDEEWPITGALLWALAAAFRQEMLFAGAPLALVVAGLVSDGSSRPRWARGLRLVVAAAICFALLGAQRYAHTGRFAISTQHGGSSAVGAWMPDAYGDWRAPWPFVADVAPEALFDDVVLARRAPRLILGELGRRPLFHAVRMTGGVLRAWTLPDRLLHWSLVGPGAIAPEHAAAAATVARVVAPISNWSAAVWHGAFVAGAILVWRRRTRAGRVALVALGLTMAAKAGVHALVVTQARYFLAVTALEILAIGVAVEVLCATGRPSRRLFAWLALGAGVMGLVAVGADELGAMTLARDEDDALRTPRIALAVGGAQVSCRLEAGRLWTYERGVASVKLQHSRPPVGEMARVRCELPVGGVARSVVLQPLEPEGAPVVRSLVVDGREAWRAAGLPAAVRIAIAGARAIELRVEATPSPSSEPPHLGRVAGVTSFAFAAD